MQTRTPAPANKLFGLGSFWSGYFFWPGSRVTPAAPLSTDQVTLAAPLSTNNVAQLPIIQKTQEKTSSTASDSSDELSPTAIRNPVTFVSPKMMPEIYKLRLIQDYTAYYLDHLTADSREDEERYQHNKKIILDMIALGKEVIKLPTTKEDIPNYCTKMTQYDDAIRVEKRKFNPRLAKYERRTPSFAGKKSKMLTYLYFGYLFNFAEKKTSPNINTQQIDRFRWKEIVDAFSTVTTIGIDFADIDTDIAQMRAAVKLRKQRLIELSRPAGTLEIEKTVALLSDEDKEKWMQKAVKALQLLHRECEDELRAHPEKFPAQSKSDLYEAYLCDLVYARAPDYHLFTKRCSEEDYKKIQAFAKILDNQAEVYAEKVNAFKRIGTAHPIDTQNDSDNSDSDSEKNNTECTATPQSNPRQSIDRVDSLNSASSVSFDDESSNESEGEDNTESEDEEEVRAAEGNTRSSSLSLSQW